MASSFSFARIICLCFLLTLAHSKTLKRDVKALNEIKASLGWRVVYAWVGDDPCGDGDLPPWSGVTCSNQGDYRVVTELEVYAVSIVGPFPIAVTNLLDLTRLPATALARKCLALQVDGPPRGRGRPKRTWMKVIKIDPEKCNLFEDLAQYKSEWRNRIHVANPTIVGTRL